MPAVWPRCVRSVARAQPITQPAYDEVTRQLLVHQNLLTEQLMEQMRADGLTDLLMMGAGPWKHASCMSAYCVDAQRMADAVHMKCWADDGKIRYFSLILFQSA